MILKISSSTSRLSINGSKIMGYRVYPENHIDVILEGGILVPVYFDNSEQAQSCLEALEQISSLW